MFGNVPADMEHLDASHKPGEQMQTSLSSESNKAQWLDVVGRKLVQRIFI